MHDGASTAKNARDPLEFLPPLFLAPSATRGVRLVSRSLPIGSGTYQKSEEYLGSEEGDNRRHD